MPRVEVGSQSVWVKIEASEASVKELGEWAIGMLKQAAAICDDVPSGPASGLHEQRRPTDDHQRPGPYGRRIGFHPVQVQS